MQPQPARQSCHEKDELTEALRAAMDHIVELTKREISAITDGHGRELEQLGNEVKKAQASKDWLLRKYTTHVKTHGC